MRTTPRRSRSPAYVSAVGLFATFTLTNAVRAQCQVGRIIGSGVELQHEFADEASIDGDIAAVADKNVPVPGGVDGGVYIFRRDTGGAWQEIKLITAPDATPNQGFGWSLMLRGDRLAVGMPFDDAVAGNAGAAYIFERNTGGPDNWGFVKKVLPTGALSNDHFGDAVAFDGDTLIVGAPHSDDAGTNTGSAYVFTRDQGGANQWGQVKRLLGSDVAGDRYFGDAVGASGDAVAVGAPYAPGATSQSGVVYTFVADHGGNGNWGQAARIFASDGHPGDDYGICVSLSGNDLAVGAPDSDGPYNDYGAVYLYQRDSVDPTIWTFQQKLTASDLEDSPEFGLDVEIRGNTLIAGNITDNQNANDAGAAYLFMRGGKGVWGQAYKFVSTSLAPIAYFGRAVGLSAEHVVVGAPYDNAVGQNSGAAWIFALNNVDCNANGVCDARDIATGLSADLNSNGVLDECEGYCQMPPISAVSVPASSFLGRSVDLTDDALVVGAPSGSTKTGSAWVAERAGGAPNGFAALMALVPSWLEVADAFGAAVAVDGDTAVVGSPAARVIVPGTPPAEYFEAGRAFVFQRNLSGAWVQVASLRSPAPNHFAAFGAGVDIDGDTVAIGEPDRERVQVYERNQGGSNAWGHVRTIAPSLNAEELGRSLSIDGDLLVAGAPAENAPLSDSGAAYVFARNQGGPSNWGLVKKVVASNGANSDRFGTSVAIGGDFVAVGALGVDGPGSSPDFGRAYVFEQDLGGINNWGERAQLHAGPFSRFNMLFGTDIAISGDRVLVGAPENFSPYFNPGSAYAFERDAGGPDAWGRVARLVAHDPVNDDRFGVAVALQGSEAVIGAELRLGATPFQGSLYVLDVTGADCNLNALCDSFDVLSDASPDLNRNGVPDECELPSCPADIDDDDSVNINDLLEVINNWGACAGTCPPACSADVDPAPNGDCQVNINDLLEVINNWGRCP